MLPIMPETETFPSRCCFWLRNPSTRARPQVSKDSCFNPAPRSGTFKLFLALQVPPLRVAEQTLRGQTSSTQDISLDPTEGKCLQSKPLEPWHALDTALGASPALSNSAVSLCAAASTCLFLWQLPPLPTCPHLWEAGHVHCQELWGLL